MPKLDRLAQFDARSRAYPIRAVVGEKTPRSYTWACDAYNDQGTEGACVGFAWSHELAARPVVGWTSEADALSIYRRARQLDGWPGEDYDGTSVLAGAKAAKERGRLVSYRWGFSLDDLILAVGYTGPAVLGVNWYEGMFDTDSSGYVRATGSVAGGHAILCRGVSVRARSSCCTTAGAARGAVTAAPGSPSTTWPACSVRTAKRASRRCVDDGARAPPQQATGRASCTPTPQRRSRPARRATTGIRSTCRTASTGASPTPRSMSLCGLCHDSVHDWVSWLLGEARQPMPEPGRRAKAEAQRTVDWYREASA